MQPQEPIRFVDSEAVADSSDTGIHFQCYVLKSDLNHLSSVDGVFTAKVRPTRSQAGPPPISGSRLPLFEKSNVLVM